MRPLYTTITTCFAVLLITGCGASSDSSSSDSPLAPSITLDTDTPLESLPDVELAGTGDTSGVISLGESVTAATDDASDGAADGAADGATGVVDAGDVLDGVSISADIEAIDGVTDSVDPSSSLSIDSPPTIDPQFRAGTLTAADYDDQLNPHLYQRYASEFLQRSGRVLDLPYLDLANRIEINVTDQNGDRNGGVTLQLSNGNENILTLKTPASGTTYLYSDIDNLPEQFTIRATDDTGAAVDQSLTLSEVTNAGVININLPTLSTQVAPEQDNSILDVMFVIDTTGSMGDELFYLQTELTPIINAIPHDQNLLNIGLTFYRDTGDAYVVRSHDFTNDISSAQSTLNSETFGGGGDYPEAMDQALNQALDASWTDNSKRILFLIADAPPHNNKMRATWNAAERARDENIHIVPIAASGVGPNAEYLMRSMAAYTNSRYLFLTDDSGFGNSHAEPTIDCYVVTQLNNLMIRVMNSLLTGERDEPSINEVVRLVGNYNGGVCDAQE